MANIVVLGGTGFVGRHMMERANDRGHTVSSLSRRDGCDFLDLDQLANRLQEAGPDVVVNCGADVGSVHYVTAKAADVADINLRMQLNIFRAVQRATPRALLINPIANCAYPGYLEVYSEDRFWDGPLHPSVLSYGSTRRMMVVLAECYIRQYDMKVISFLVPNMYGPYDATDPNKAHALNALAGKIVKATKEGNDRLEVWGTGAAVREWLYAGDFAAVVLEAMERPEDRSFVQPLNIGQLRGFSVREIVDTVLAESSFQGEIFWDTSKPDGAPRKVMDDGLFRRAFPDFQFTDLRSGIRDTLAYYESIYPF